ncbi:hypothetical protein ACFX1X_004397 [Malus domestica]
MEMSTSVRKPHTSTIDLLTWSETPPADSPLPSFAYRPHQPSDGDQKGGVWRASDGRGGRELKQTIRSASSCFCFSNSPSHIIFCVIITEL